MQAWTDAGDVMVVRASATMCPRCLRTRAGPVPKLDNGASVEGGRYSDRIAAIHHLQGRL